MDYSEHNKVLALLSQAWEVYARSLLDHRNFDLILWHIQECQRLVIEEDPFRNETTYKHK